MTSLPDKFRASLREIISEAEAGKLEAALDSDPAVSVRFNPYKLSERPEGEQVPWNRYGFYLPERPQFTLDPSFHAGAYYVQEASSMFVEHLVREAFGDTEGLSVLDVCAAPGGKTTLYSTLAGLEGLVVANEVIRPRASVLADNVRKWGLGNVAVTSNDPLHFAGWEEMFDVVAVDAPCSGEGMFRKNDEARAEWNEDNVRLCAARQRRIVADVWNCLKPGGVLIYSTCTFNRAENEDNVAFFAGEYDCEDVAAECPGEWGVVRGEAGGIGTYRFFPHLVRGEGFFVAALRKGGGRIRPRMPKPRKSIFAELPRRDVSTLSGWVAQPEYMRFAGVGQNCYAYYAGRYDDMKHLAESLTVIHSGVCMGQLYGGKLKPDHSLAMFHDLYRGAVAVAELDEAAALDYLRRRDLADLSPLAEGLNLVCSQGAALGWIKRIGVRANNMYPMSLRIMNM